MNWRLNPDASAVWLADTDRTVDRYDATITLRPDAFFNFRWSENQQVILYVFERFDDGWRRILQEEFLSLKIAKKEAEKIFDTLRTAYPYRG